MSMVDTKIRQKLADSLNELRQLITKEELILFIGEKASCLPSAELKSLVSLIESSSSQSLVEKIDEFERTDENRSQSTAEGKRQDSKHRVHDVLRTLGRFPIIFTVNVDHYVEQYVMQKDDKTETVRLDQVGKLSGKWPNKNRVLIVNCLGKASYVESLQATKQCVKFWQEISSGNGKEAEFVQNLFNKHSCLFLGCNKPDYEQFLQLFVVKSKKRHFMYESQASEGSEYKEQGQLAVIRSDMVLAEFAQYLTPGSSQVKLEPGKVTESSFLPTQREQYLKFQLDLEKQATEIGFQTMQVTNALSTDELLQTVSRPAIKKMFENDPFYGEHNERTVDGVMKAMTDRRDNLLQLVKKGAVKVTSVFSFNTFKKEILDEETPKDSRVMALRKYATVILASRSVMNASSSLELRVLADPLPEQEARMKAEQFAVIRLQSGSDEAIAYAEPAVVGKKSYSTNLVSINGQEVARKRKIFEEFRELARDHDASLLKLTSAVIQANKGLGALREEDVNQLNQLHNLQVITDTDIEPGSLSWLGEGSFGTVYKIKWKMKIMAFKVLKNLESSALNAFLQEFETLRRVNHENVIRVESLHHNKKISQIGIIMEFMTGGSIHDLLQKTPGKGQEPEFVKACALQVARALGHLHKLKIIHRDVKADNVFMTDDRKTFKVGDFGLARESQTYQTKTINRGAYRYMAPEVQKTGKYSFKVDVYSYGLMLLEVITGKEVFDGIVKHSDVHALVGAGKITPQIPDTVEKSMKLLVTKCVEYDSKKRPKMSYVLDILEGRVETMDFNMFSKGEINLICLGTGKGATAITRGGPSSSFVIFNGEKPLMLVDIGLGVMMSYQEHVGQEHIPCTFFVTHNHTDHAGELPVSMIVLFQQYKKKYPNFDKSPLTVISGPEVIPRLTEHRMHEAFSMESDVNKFAKWVSQDPNDEPLPLDGNKHFTLKTAKSQHGEVGYGFVLYYKGHPILGYSGDSGFNKTLYNTIFEADTVVVDARGKGTVEHAGFDEVQKFAKEKRHDNIFITGYGMPDEYAPPEGGANLQGLQQLETGESYTLWPYRPILEKGSDNTLQSDSSGQSYPSTVRAVTD